MSETGNLIKALTDFGLAGVVIVALWYIVKIMRGFHMDMREADNKRTDMVISTMNTNLALIQRISDTLNAASQTLFSATIESRELLREMSTYRQGVHDEAKDDK